MCARDRDQELEDEFEAQVRSERALIEKGRREKGQTFWSYLGLIGVVGWSVVVPMVAGLFVGVWVDGKFGGGYRWTLGLLVFGLSVGCYNAWRLITKEH